jgi:siroheme decarboxylase
MVDLSPLEFALLNRWQRSFPLDARPYQRLAEHLNSSEAEVISTLTRLKASGHISRIGAVFRPHTLGWSTLAAVAVHSDQVERAARLINAHPEVNHNYEREHHWNLWFVVAAAHRTEVERVLGEIGSETGCVPLNLPMVQDYHIDLGFDLGGDDASPHRRAEPHPTVVPALDDCDRALCSALEPGLEISPRPYAAVAAVCGETETEIAERIKRLQTTGIIRRFGVIVRHRELGFTANAMVVWAIPPEHIHAVGQRLGADPAVTLCYQRPASLPDWPYTLFSMVHGKDRATVLAEIARLRSSLDLTAFEHAPLFSQRRFKQCGARYSTPLARAA